MRIILLGTDKVELHGRGEIDFLENDLPPTVRRNERVYVFDAIMTCGSRKPIARYIESGQPYVITEF